LKSSIKILKICIFNSLHDIFIRYAIEFRTNNMTDNTKLSLEELPDLLTVKEVAQVLRVSPLTIKRWGKRGKLPAIRINSRGDRRYKKEAVLWLLGITQKTS
jgi:excisionase family DNA binding protein